MSFPRSEPVAALELSDILRTTDRGIWVRIKATGKLAWLPRSRSQIFNRTAFVPQWLADKLCPASGGPGRKAVPCKRLAPRTERFAGQGRA